MKRKIITCLLLTGCIVQVNFCTVSASNLLENALKTIQEMAEENGNPKDENAERVNILQPEESAEFIEKKFGEVVEILNEYADVVDHWKDDDFTTISDIAEFVEMWQSLYDKTKAVNDDMTQNVPTEEYTELWLKFRDDMKNASELFYKCTSLDVNKDGTYTGKEMTPLVNSTMENSVAYFEDAISVYSEIMLLYENNLSTVAVLNVQESKDLLDEKYEELNVILEDLQSLLDYWNETDFDTFLDIIAYENMWKEISNKAEKIKTDMTQNVPPQAYTELWEQFRDDFGLVSEIFSKGESLDANHDTEYTGEEMVGVLRTIKEDAMVYIRDANETYKTLSPELAFAIMLGQSEGKDTKKEEPQTVTHTPTLGEQNALESAKIYLDYTHFSYKGLIEQLEYEGYTKTEATYAVDNCGADWKEQAAGVAKDYLNYTSFSRSGLSEQLAYEGFTSSQIDYALKAVGY